MEGSMEGAVLYVISRVVDSDDADGKIVVYVGPDVHFAWEEMVQGVGNWNQDYFDVVWIGSNGRPMAHKGYQPIEIMKGHIKGINLIEQYREVPE